MFCPKCGKQNKEGAIYCTECGRGLMRRAAVHTKQPRRGKHLAAFISLSVIAAAIIVFFVFFSGTPVEGLWCCESEFSVLVFKDGQAQVTGLSGTQQPEYEYSRQNGEGTLTIDGIKYAFSVGKDELTLQSPEGNTVFLRAKDDIDTQSIVKEGLLGLWSNEELAKVFELKENGGFTVYSIEGEQSSAYDFDIERGEGSLVMGKAKTIFTADKKKIEITGLGTFIRQKSGFDIAAFIVKYGKPLVGIWYDASGVMGRFSFQNGGILSVASYGKEYRGTYTFSNAEGKGTLSFSDITMDIVYSGETLKIKGKSFTKEYAAQKGAKDVFEQLAGKWYDKQGNGTIEISADGKAVFIRDGNTQSADCTFDPLDGMGELKLRGGNDIKVLNLLVSNGMLAAGEWLYTRDVVEQKNSKITGTWYDSGGRVGTLTLKDGGSAELDFTGSKYTGTYSFDEALGKGTITTVFNGQTWTFDMELRGEQLVITTGILFYNEVVFTREDTAQPEASPAS